MAYETELRVALEAAREAAALCQDVRLEMASSGSPSQALTKEDHSPVTVADFGSQALVCRRIAESFPDDSIVAEEDATELREPANRETGERVASYVARYHSADADKVKSWIDLGNGAVGPRYWTVDPIDGTKGFLRQDQYAVAIALVEAGEVQVGVLACPALSLNEDEGCLFAAVRGEGVSQMSLTGGGTTGIRVADGNEPSLRRFVESVEASHGNHELQRAIATAAGIEAPSLRMDSQAKYGAVARGDAVLYLRLPSPKYPDYREKVWDHAAGTLVVEEAGGQVTDLLGARLDFTAGQRLEKNRGVVVSNGALHATVIDALKPSARSM